MDKHKQSDKITFEIFNFRNLVQVKYSLVEREVNYIVASNEAGKTNLAKAIRLCSGLRRAHNLVFDDDDITRKESIKSTDKFLIRVTSNGVVNLINDSLEQIYNIHNKMHQKLDLPYVIYREPRIYAEEKWEPKFKLSDVLEKKEEWNVTNCLVEAFSTADSEKFIASLKTKINEENGVDKRDLKKRTVDALNSEIANYFKKFNCISAFPVLDLERDVFSLLIRNKKGFQIDFAKESARSDGFKCFFRIILELKSLSSSSEKVIYIIDEPEQNLHPLLQIEFRKELFDIVSKSKNLTLMLITHSPYMMNHSEHDISSKNISFLSRSELGGVDCQTLDQEGLSKMISSFFDKLTTQDVGSEMFVLRLVLDQIHMSKLEKHINRRRKKIKILLDENKIGKEEFDREMNNIYLLKDLGLKIV